MLTVLPSELWRARAGDVLERCALIEAGGIIQQWEVIGASSIIRARLVDKAEVCILAVGSDI
jgi:hypothetical protein